MMTKVGNYALGTRRVNVFLDPTLVGASFDSRWSDTKGARVIVGTKGHNWHRVVGNLCHEVGELVLSDLRARWTPDVDYSEGSDGYFFHYNHDIHSEATARVGCFIADALPDISRAFKRSAAR